MLDRLGGDRRSIVDEAEVAVRLPGRKHEADPGRLVRLHEQRVTSREEFADGEAVWVATGKGYPSFEEAATAPRPGVEGEGCMVGRSDCTSQTQRASSSSSP